MRKLISTFQNRNISPAINKCIFLILVISSLVCIIFWANEFYHKFVAIIQNQDNVSGDFRYYLCGAEQFANSITPYGTCSNEPVAGFLYPPVALLYYYPLYRMGPTLAFLAQFLLSLFLILFVILKSHNHLLQSNRSFFYEYNKFSWLYIILILGIAPLNQTLYAGQADIIVLAIFIATFLAFQNKWYWLACTIVAAGFWFKLYPVIIIPFLFFITFKFSIVTRFILVTFFIAVASLAVIDISLYQQYFLSFLPTLQDLTVPGWSHSLVGELFYLTDISPSVTEPFASQKIPLIVKLIALGVLALGLCISILHYRTKTSESHLESVALLLVAVLAYSPLAWGGTFVLAIPILMLCLLRLGANQTTLTESVLICMAYFSFLIPSWTSLPFQEVLGNYPVLIYTLGHLFYARYLLFSLILAAILIARSSGRYQGALKEILKELKMMMQYH